MAKLFAKEKTFRLALVGAETLLGRELQEVLGNRIPEAAITAYSATGEGSFGEQEGEAIFLNPLDAAAVRDQHAIVLAGSPQGASKAYEIAKSAGGRPAIIDCAGHLEDRPEARIAAPLLEELDPRSSWLLVLAHPAACALALVFHRLARYRKIRQSMAEIFEPASERGKAGISELHQQTTSLLAFKPLEKTVFDAQLSFNLLPQYGSEAPLQLSTVERCIERDLTTLLGRKTEANVPMPSLRVIQAPVFHGYSLSIRVEFETEIVAAELGEALASAQIEIRGASDSVPDIVGAASQSGLIAGDIRVDTNNPRAAWVWVVGDNLRLTADAVADLLAGLQGESK